MITEHDLREAIAECEGTRNPSSSTCVKLAAFYTILEHLYGTEKKNTQEILTNGYSYASEPSIFYSDSEFSQTVKEKGINECFPIIDELMSTLYVINPSLYRSVIRKLTELN